MKIKLDSRIGKFCGVKISADTLETDEAKAAAYLWAMTFGLFHKVGSKVYYAKTAEAKAKVGKHSREAAYSENLARDVKASCNDILKSMFSNIEVETFAVVPADPWEMLRKQLKSLDYTPEQIEAAIAIKVATAPVSPAKSEPSDEAELS